MSGFSEMLAMQEAFIEQATSAGIDVDITTMRDGTALTTRTGIYRARAEREAREFFEDEK